MTAALPMSSALHPSCHSYYVLAPTARPYVRLEATPEHSLYMQLILKEAAHSIARFLHVRLDFHFLKYIISLTHMKQVKANTLSRTVDAKASVLGQHGALHPHPEEVQDGVFQQNEFFDPRDLVQVRYEMLRRRQVDGQPVTDVAAAFGVSRQAFYVTEAVFAEKGIVGLLPRPRGPQRAHKCTDEILDFVEQWTTDPPAGADISEAVQKRFGVSIHPRSLARALGRRKKNQH